MLHLVYRISDEAQTAASKPKLEAATKRRCLLDCLRLFGSERTTIVADSVSDETHDWIESVSGGATVVRTHYRSGGLSFLHAAAAIAGTDLPGDTPVYMCEDDYMHADGSVEMILDGLSHGDYCTLYDHPDKRPKPTKEKKQRNAYIRRFGARFNVSKDTTYTIYLPIEYYFQDLYPERFLLHICFVRCGTAHSFRHQPSGLYHHVE